MFEIGQRILCVDASGSLYISKGRQYTVLYQDATFVYFKGDNGAVVEDDPERFIAAFSENAARKVGSVLFDSVETAVTSASGGTKGQKPLRYDLIPVEALSEVAYIYARGAEKYGDNNYRKGYPYSSSLAALHRHLEKFKSGVDFDDEFDGEVKPHHLAAVVFHALTLMQFQATDVGTDDRAN